MHLSSQQITSSMVFFVCAAALLLALPLWLFQLETFANFTKAECDIESEWTSCMEAADKVNGWEQNRLNPDKVEDVAAHKADTDRRECTLRCLAVLGVACALCAVQSYAMLFFAPQWKVFRVSVLFIPTQSWGCDGRTKDFSTEMSETSVKIDKKPCACECGLGFKKENLCPHHRYLKIILSTGGVKPRDSDIISKHEVTLANQKPEGKWKRNMAKNGSTSTTTAL